MVMVSKVVWRRETDGERSGSAKFRNASLLARLYFCYYFPVIGAGNFRIPADNAQLKGFIALLFPIKCGARDS